MREISARRIKDAVAELCITANKVLPADLRECIKSAGNNEAHPLPKSVMADLSDNIAAAKELDIPVCQDCGIAVVFLTVGQDVHITGGGLYAAVNEGVRTGYKDGLLRKSVVADPLNRVNTEDNTPAIIHTDIVDGESLKITVAPKGFGSENMSGIKMLEPSAAREDVIDTVAQIVKSAGANPCPPIVVGVGIGGDFEYSAVMAKRALCRPVHLRNENPYYKELEDDILQRLNTLDIGPQGFGGATTALAVNVEYFATHIAGLPVAVNIGCHVNRHASKIL